MSLLYLLLMIYAIYLSINKSSLRHIIYFIALLISLLSIFVNPYAIINIIILLFIFNLSVIDYKKIINNEFYYVPLIKIIDNRICYELIVLIFKYKFIIRLKY